MGEMVVQGSKYSNEDRIEAAIQYAVTGSLTKTSKVTGMAKGTLHGMMQQDWWDEVVAEVRTEKAAEHRARYSKLVDKAQSRALKKIGKACARDAVWIAGVCTDKLRLHDNLPTSITAKSEDYQSLAKQFKELSEQWEEKQVGVVSTQHKEQSKT